MPLRRSHGYPPLSGNEALQQRKQIIRYINLKLVALGYRAPMSRSHDNGELLEMCFDLVQNYQEKMRLLSEHLCPVDRRIQDFINKHFRGMALNGPVDLPRTSMILDRHGLARELSIPVDGNHFESELLSSYRVAQGVLHNPRSDRRTTKGVFHVAEGGLPVPADKVSVPKVVFGNMLHAALNPPKKLLRLPYTVGTEQEAELMLSLLIRPLVCPEVPGKDVEKRMEMRFFAPGSLVANLDFVESIFGNAGDPFLPENDAALDVDHWTGNTGCVILAPHLVNLKKKDVGLPHYDQATTRQREQGMCWKDPEETYNSGSAFKLVCRTHEGTMITLIADNYFGYCKKEVKTQISLAANLFGLAEEEHAGGALAFPRYNYGDDVNANRPARHMHLDGHSFAEIKRLYSSFIDFKPEGYGVDKNFSNVIYVPEDVHISLPNQSVSWKKDGVEQSIKLLPETTYVLPSGYKVHLEKHPGAPTWRLIGTEAEGTFCHKPCTVSGGGKSEISKSINDAVLYGPIFVSDHEKDFELVDEIFNKDYSKRHRDPNGPACGRPSRPVLSPMRSLGSVIKLLTPSAVDFTDEYNAWLRTIPNHVLALVFIIKRFYNPEWGSRWREYFSVDIVNGSPGHELKYMNRKLVGSYLRVGLSEDGSWRTYKLRQDFIPAEKVQMEDDISASVVVPAAWLPGAENVANALSKKLVMNCEFRLFQRPDDAIHRGYDKQTERDMAENGNFISNFEPLTTADAKEMIEDIIHFDKFTAPMQDLIKRAAAAPADCYFVSSAHPRIVNGKPSQNPRYLQVRPDVVNEQGRYLAVVGARLYRKLPVESPVVFPVDAVLAGRRNNPPDLAARIRPLAVYNPIHYQELPELFMDFICSLTGKSPSTTGAGSEGPLTKGPFNAICAAADLNNALVSYLLTGQQGFTTAAGYVGPHIRVDHDISLLIPEIWCRLRPNERDAQFLIREKCLEKLNDFQYQGRTILASRLGYRITSRFVHTYFGRVFDNPSAVFDEAILKPETQGLDVYVDGIENIVEAQKRVALQFFEDGSVNDACPPLHALLHIMAHGNWKGKDANHPDVRAMFTREYLLNSNWYKQRLADKQTRDIALWTKHVSNLRSFLSKSSHSEPIQRLNLRQRLQRAERMLEQVRSPEYLDRLWGTIGADPVHQGIDESEGPVLVGERSNFQRAQK
ncbi:MAG TPA: hypothetical protein VEK08_19705 [Planctomycetota bacterium]|nr:hypothetical protein [Planctomycetota bacterium]